MKQQEQNINKTVVVTGSAGFIGGAMCIGLKNKGYRVVGIDKRYGKKHLEPYIDVNIKADFSSFVGLSSIEKENPIAIIHCGGTSLVGPSMTDPAEYYDNNVVKTARLLYMIKDRLPKTKFIFSSSASVYGEPKTGTLFETDETNPISPYGESKLMTEKMLHWYNKAYGLDYVAFRYFNACGSVGSIHGQEPNATHIFARVFESILNDEPFKMYGINYPTKDGTCVRDYIHVEDIVDAHIAAIDENILGIYNIGSYEGHSNFEVFYAVESYMAMENLIPDGGAPFMVELPREGDPATLIANSDKLQKDTSWKPRKELDDIVKDLYEWYTSNTYNSMTQRS